MTIVTFPGGDSGGDSAGPPPEVPGFTLGRLLGRGGHGVVWAAEDLVSGEPVAVKVGRGVSASLEAEVALLQRISHPHVVALRQYVPLPGGGCALVLELAAGGSLADLVARRDVLSEGEASTLLVPLGATLEHVHRRGLVHGDLTPGNVLFAADGRPMLADLGTAQVLGVSSEEGWRTPGFADPALLSDPAVDPRAADVWGLAAVAWYALMGVAPPPGVDEPDPYDTPLLALLRRCLSLDPSLRPGPAEVASLAWDAAAPEPVRLELSGQAPPPVEVPLSQRVTRPPLHELVGPEPLAVPEVRSRWRLPVGLLAVAALLAVGLLAVAAVLARPVVFPPPGEQVPPTVALPTPSIPVEAELLAALNQIGAARAEAFRTGTTGPLARADEQGSPAATSDAALVQRLLEAGRRIEGAEVKVRDLRVVSGAGTSAVTVAVRSSTSAYRQVRVSDGASVDLPAEPARDVRITLVKSPDGWRVRSVA
ncbi:protein kinase [Spongisporangium articulatum]|uniref:Protein kinase n=1 Tax=Spongisporangium articulatum TaxID=3362603 RepID=A0ABW8AUG6_9ACTN